MLSSFKRLSIFRSPMSIELSKTSLITFLTCLSLVMILSIVNYLQRQLTITYYYPQMQLMYFVGMIITPFLILAFNGLLKQIEKSFFPRSFPSLKLTYILSAIWISALIFLLLKQKFFLLPRHPILIDHYFLTLSIGLLFLFNCGCTKRTWLRSVFYFFLIGLSLAVFWLLIIDYLSMVNFITNPVNQNAVFSSLIQAADGRLPLIDYYAQYGYYSFFLSKLFYLIPLTLPNLNIMNALLSILVFVFYYLGIRNCIQQPFIRIAALMGCFYGLFFSYGYDSVYWANLPIRSLFPALGFWLITIYQNNESVKCYYLIFLICTLATAWNIDTGLILLFSWMIFLVATEFNQSSLVSTVTFVFKTIATGTLFIIFMIIFYGGYTLLTRGRFPDFFSIFMFQNLFFGQGILTVPMTIFDSWTIVMLIYISGLVVSISLICRKLGTKKNKAGLILFLSLQGIGIFSYFIMRSIPTNLFIVSWPAIILLGVYANQLQHHKYCFYASLLVLPLIVYSLNIYAITMKDLSTPRMNNAPVLLALEKDRAWLKSLGIQNRKIVIISDREAIFYMDLRGHNPLSIPGSTELLNTKFIKIIANYITNKSNDPRFLLIDTTMYLYSNPLYEEIRNLVNRMPIYKKNPEGNLFLYKLD